MTHLWWVSFAGVHEFLGACIVEAASEFDVASAAWAHGCNPGGEARMLRLDEFTAEQIREKGFDLWRLYSREEIEQRGKAVRW